MNTYKLLIDNLIAFQKTAGLSDKELSAKLGISDSYFSRIKRGLRKPGIKCYQGIVVAYPELKPLVDAEMYGKTHYMHTEIPVRKTLMTKFLEVFK
ncbi:MAG: hypothetical protein A9183_06890 [Dehalococcoides mccartyi]|nr:MAG: hypothetical protein A9183_06890 [Dehalococcoides mccartyi]